MTQNNDDVINAIHELRELLKKILMALNSDPNENDFVTVEVASKILKRTPRTIRAWCSSKKLKAIKAGHGRKQDRIYISRDSIKNLLGQKQSCERRFMK